MSWAIFLPILLVAKSGSKKALLATNIFVIDKRYATELDTKLRVFQNETGTRKTLFPTMITTYGVRQNQHYTGRVQAEVVMKDLFGA